MQRSKSAIIALVVTVAACSDSPTAAVQQRPTPRMPNGSSSLQITSNPACTHHWASGVAGSWFDNTKWSPATVPTAADVACIDAAGTYIVTLDPANDVVPVDVTGINVGGGATGVQTLRLTSSQYLINVSQNIEIAASGTLNPIGGGLASVITIGGALVNQGVMTESGTPGKIIRGDVDNQGTLTTFSGLTLDKVNGAYVNSGSITLSNSIITIPASSGAATFAMNGGTIDGTANASYLVMRTGTFTLNGGTIDTRANGLPSVELQGANLVMSPGYAGSANVGAGSTLAGNTTISGDVGPNTVLVVEGPLSAVAGSITYLGNPTNNGTIRLDRQFYGGTSLTLAGAGTLTNAGTILLPPSSPAHLAIDVTNNGTISLGGNQLWFDKAGGVYENFGTIGIPSQGTLSVTGSTLRNHPSGVIASLQLTLDAAQLVGTGSVQRLTVTNGSTVSPGFSPGVINSVLYTPDATSALLIELAGTTPGTQYDQLVTSGQATFNGTLNVAESGGFQSGLCGQTFDVVVHSSPGGSSTFATVTGLNPGPGRALRTAYQNGTPRRVTLVGYNPTAKVSIAPNPAAVTEGQPGVQYAVCLDHAPVGGTVTVTPTADAQVSVQPASLVFSTSNWQLPQFFTVTAVDDATIEAPHIGTVTHAVTSNDPSYNGTPVAPLVANITDNDGSADLTLTISSPPPPLTLNQVFNVSFRIKSFGPTLSTGANVTFQPIGGFQFQSAINATCSGSASGLTCLTPGVAVGGELIFTLTLKATQRGVFQKTITVTGQQPDPNAANNTIVRNLTIN